MNIYRESFLSVFMAAICSETIRKDRMVFETVTGSHAFGMQRPDSDLDITCVYIHPTREILLGRVPAEKVVKETEGNKELKLLEIGAFIHHLIKGDINAYIAVLSNRVFQTSAYHQNLKKLVLTYPSTHGIYRSLKGMIEHDTQRGTTIKKYGIHCRIINMLSKLMKHEENRFMLRECGVEWRSENEMYYLRKQLWEGIDITALEEAVPELYEDLLLKIRMEDMNNNDTR